jgi:phospholipid/cholesterol/gamma-HCH transport system substrate-binding protein
MSGNLGPGPLHRSETHSAATPIAAGSGRHFGVRSHARPLAGLAMVALIAGIVAVAVILFRGGFVKPVPVTVVSERAGLVMNPDAKVKMRGVEVGKVASIEDRPDGHAILHLAMDPTQVHLIPSNVTVDIASTTVFGAKYVQLEAPPNPSPQPIREGQVIDAKSVTVEINTVFEQLQSVLSKIEPAKLNQTLGALAQGVDGRGQKIGQMLSDFDHLLATLDPSLPNLRHDISVAPEVLRAYGDAAPDLLSTVKSATTISQTFVDEQNNLDAVLVSAIGLADIGNDVVGTNRQPLTDVLHLLAPTTDLLHEYAPGLNCSLGGILDLSNTPPLPVPGILVSTAFPLAAERYRYPGHLPKVAATGGPHCTDMGLPVVPPNFQPPYLVADVGANPWQYGNQGILLNSDGLKQLLYGPIDGPPRNSAQIGQPG